MKGEKEKTGGKIREELADKKRRLERWLINYDDKKEKWKKE
jgi:hypothetical protein